MRQTLLRALRDVPDLNVAKSTFFALTDEKGIGIRNNLDQDAMAGQDLAKLFPGISKAIGGEYVETVGSFGGPPGPNGADKDWLAAMPIKKDGKVAGLFVTGWSYRRFASHLQEVLKETFQSNLRQSGDTGKMPSLLRGGVRRGGRLLRAHDTEGRRAGARRRQARRCRRRAAPFREP